jgi:hypothetical protein
MGLTCSKSCNDNSDNLFARHYKDPANGGHCSRYHYQIDKDLQLAKEGQVRKGKAKVDKYQNTQQYTFNPYVFSDVVPIDFNPNDETLQKGYTHLSTLNDIYQEDGALLGIQNYNSSMDPIIKTDETKENKCFKKKLYIYQNNTLLDNCGGKCGKISSQDKRYVLEPCGDDCPRFTEWGSCTATCGGGQQFRTCTDGKKQGISECEGDWARECNTQPCKIHCEVTPWSEWTPCAPCNLKRGTTSRYRNIITGPQYGGTSCPSLEENEDCNVSDDCYKHKYGLSVENKNKITEHIQKIKNLI